MYQKEIIYMGLFHDQVKERNAGYLKVNALGGVYRLELQVKNMSGAITGNFPIRLQSETGWQEADMLAIKEGNGKWNGSIAGPVLRAEIILSDTSKIKGESKLAAAEERKEEKPDTAALSARSKRQQEEQPEQMVQIAVEQERTPEPEAEAETETAPVMRAESMSDRPGSRERVKPAVKAERISVKPEHTPLYENKWEQLLTTYEQIHPYGDNRIYIKLAPKDFVILRENYQHLVNNSFLLHGFYNYRYLILGKEKDFYLGVPGVFYEREKMVALMFGFEAFECEGGKAEEGRFGYYLRKVEL